MFSAVLLGTLVVQAATHRPADGWLYAAPVIAMMFFVSLVPAVLAYGLSLMDNGARVATVIFTLLHAISTVLYLEHTPTYWRPWTRLAIDAFIVTYLLLRHTRQRFDEEQKLLLRWTEPGA